MEESAGTNFFLFSLAFLHEDAVDFSSPVVCLEVRQLEGQTDQNCRRLVELAEALTEQLPGLSTCCCGDFLSLVLFPLFGTLF